MSNPIIYCVFIVKKKKTRTRIINKNLCKLAIIMQCGGGTTTKKNNNPDTFQMHTRCISLFCLIHIIPLITLFRCHDLI